MRTLTALAMASLLPPTVIACGSGGRAPESAPSTATESTESAARSDIWELTPNGPEIHYVCRGDGDPAVLLEAGTDTAGSQAYADDFMGPLAERTTVCTYDRLGTGLSSPPPDQRRTIGELTGVADQLWAGIGVAPPYLLVGQSGGGGIMIDYAARNPDKVAGLVLIEAYHDDPAEMRAWQRDAGFTWSDNPEHMDWVAASGRLDRLHHRIGDFPLVVISATNADPGGAQNQRFWLALSPNSRQYVVEGGHDLHQEVPEVVERRILEMLETL